MGVEYQYQGANLKIYEGEWALGQRSGQGALYYADGQSIMYRGEWLEGKQHGKGALYNRDGSVKWEGTFKFGNPVRKNMDALLDESDTSLLDISNLDESGITDLDKSATNL